MNWSGNRRLVAAVAIVLLAACLRTWRLAALPPGLHHDEAFHLLEAQKIASGAGLPIFITGNQGNEPLFAYSSALTIFLLGPVNWAGRLVAVWYGVVSVAATIRAGRELFPRRSVGLFAGLALAGLFWHLDISRWGTQPILSAAAAGLTIALLWHGMRHGRWQTVAVAGLALAAGLWAYVAFRLFVVVPVAGLVAFALSTRHWRQAALSAAILGAVTLLAIAPLAGYFVLHPEWFWNRYGQVTAITLGSTQMAHTLALNAVSVARGLFLPGAGDLNWRQNLAGRPAFDGLQFLAFGLGLVIAARQWRRPEVWTLVAWVGVGLASTILTEFPPQFGRSVMVTPALAILMGLGWDWFVRHGRRPALSRWVAGLLLVASLLVTIRDYFDRWANNPNLFRAFDVGLAWVASELRAAPAGSTLYETPVYREYPTLEYLLGAEAYQRFRAFNGRACLVAPAMAQTDAFYGILVGEDTRTLPALESLFPTGRRASSLTASDDESGGMEQVVTFHIPAATAASLPPTNVPAVDFAGTVRLRGFAIEPNRFVAGESLCLSVTWELLQPTPADLRSFVHLLGPARADGSPLYAQRDAQPCDNSYPTWQWAPGELLVDRVEVRLPIDTPPGLYQLNVGWYDSGTLQRLEATDPVGAPLGDTLTLQSVQIAGP